MPKTFSGKKRLAHRVDAEMIEDSEISNSTTLRTDYYVYFFRNPLDNNNIFYIGKGTGNRAEQLNNRNEKTKEVIDAIRVEFSKKNKYIEDIIEVLRENLDEKTALDIESAAIDLIGIPPLTNKNRGTRPKKWLPKNFETIDTTTFREIVYPDEAPNINERAILIRINQLYRYGMDADSLYDATRGIWVLGPRRKLAEYAFSIFKGRVMEVYKINQWFQAGTEQTIYKTRPDINGIYPSRRWGFEGDIAEDAIREKYLNKSVKRYLTKNSQSPIIYINC